MIEAADALERGQSAETTTAGLPLPVPGELRQCRRRAGRLTYYVAGDGPPLLLIHSINAAASAYEVRPIFERAMATHRVYAPDLPGYGHSDRAERTYNVRLFADAIQDLVDVMVEDTGPSPIDALAISLSSEFLARTAHEAGNRFRSLALITPTGFDRRAERSRGRPGETREVPGLHSFFTSPLWSQSLFDLLVSRPSIRFFLRKTFGAKDVDPDLVDYAYRTTHQPGARHAPYAFVSGRLFSRDIRTVYESLALPVWLTQATRGDFKDFSGDGWVRGRANWTTEIIDAGALPHFEDPDGFFERYRAFLERAGACR